jgi:hypothetical protein
MLVAVTSCRSDGYYNQKAPGTISKLPRKAPTNLKLFHELAVGVKDAYAAVGETPQKPDPAGNDKNGEQMSRDELDARTVLWEFVGNLDFVSLSTGKRYKKLTKRRPETPTHPSCRFSPYSYAHSYWR